MSTKLMSPFCCTEIGWNFCFSYCQFLQVNPELFQHYLCFCFSFFCSKVSSVQLAKTTEDCMLTSMNKFGMQADIKIARTIITAVLFIISSIHFSLYKNVSGIQMANFTSTANSTWKLISCIQVLHMQRMSAQLHVGFFLLIVQHLNLATEV